MRAELTAPVVRSAGCGCARCQPPAPLDDLQAQAAVRHVVAADAVAYANGALALVSCVDCAECGCWIPTFTDAEA